ncbi:Retrovirus-related Pol polyprotein from transposon TNT 1-94 [Senna tora]|uniref:Retrovirus-related Pol polyprotein from transposon TNT 1-94 n=1 Tax=Senna tora TaxID=362788 RepID=A0A834SSN4_9FABA|nr:Retrovirus-related Pol polyprotein from transposon TNT 1-94 [Senna tora]
MAADDTAGSFVTSNVTATNETGWTDATPVLITGHKLNSHNAVTAMSQNTQDSLEPIEQSQNTQDKMFGIVYTRRQETQEKETTPMMQIHDSMPSPTEPESTSEGLNLPIALRKGVRSYGESETSEVSEASDASTSNQPVQGSFLNLLPPKSEETTQLMPTALTFSMFNIIIVDAIQRLDICGLLILIACVSKGTVFTKLEIHGRNDLSCNSTKEHQMFDFCSRSIVEIKNFLMQYCLEQNAAGYFVVQDPFSAFCEALCIDMDWTEDIKDELVDINLDNSEPRRISFSFWCCSMSSRNTVMFGTMIEYCDHCHKKGHTKDTCWEIHVKIANGTMVKVSRIGFVKISANFTLLNVLHVPTLICNLLSVSKLTRDNHCAANFKSHGCSFQDLASGKMIGSAEECNGLYLLGPTIFPAFHKTVLSVTCLPDILLWHYRLDHPNFHYMQKLHETHTTPMMQTEAEIHMPSLANTENSDEDMNFPIALRKGVKACTKHPIANFVCYYKMSKNYRAFITKVSNYGNITLSRTPSHLLVADILTKSLCGTKFEELSTKLGMINIMSAAEIGAQEAQHILFLLRNPKTSKRIGRRGIKAIPEAPKIPSRSRSFEPPQLPPPSQQQSMAQQPPQSAAPNTSSMIGPNSNAATAMMAPTIARFPFNAVVPQPSPPSKPLEHLNNNSSPYDGSSSAMRPCGFNIDAARKKRGRPRKYSPDGSAFATKIRAPLDLLVARTCYLEWPLDYECCDYLYSASVCVTELQVAAGESIVGVAGDLVFQICPSGETPPPPLSLKLYVYCAFALLGDIKSVDHRWNQHGLGGIILKGSVGIKLHTGFAGKPRAFTFLGSWPFCSAQELFRLSWKQALEVIRILRFCSSRYKFLCSSQYTFLFFLLSLRALAFLGSWPLCSAQELFRLSWKQAVEVIRILRFCSSRYTFLFFLLSLSYRALLLLVLGHCCSYSAQELFRLSWKQHSQMGGKKKKVEDRIPCLNCNQTFDNLEGLRSHNSSVHRHLENECVGCANVFPTLADSLIHKPKDGSCPLKKKDK